MAVAEEEVVAAASAVAELEAGFVGELVAVVPAAASAVAVAAPVVVVGAGSVPWAVAVPSMGAA